MGSTLTMAGIGALCRLGVAIPPLTGAGAGPSGYHVFVALASWLMLGNDPHMTLQDGGSIVFSFV
jgi:hypothetical protein